MTTVINFNFLNFFKLKLDNHNININDIRSHNQYFDNRRQDYPPEQEEIIDITPYSRVIDGNDTSLKLQLINTLKTKNPVSTSETHNIYNRKGKAIQYFHEKGLHVNSYA